MAQLLIRVVNKVNADFYLNTKCTKRGDVIVVQSDAWQWGSSELSNPDWRIIKHTELTVSEANAFLAAEVDTDPGSPSKTLQRRAFKLDVDAAVIPQTIKDWLADSTRAVPILDLTPLITLNGVRALKTAKAAIVDPNVIG